MRGLDHLLELDQTRKQQARMESSQPLATPHSYPSGCNGQARRGKDEFAVVKGNAAKMEASELKKAMYAHTTYLEKVAAANEVRSLGKQAGGTTESSRAEYFAHTVEAKGGTVLEL